MVDDSLYLKITRGQIPVLEKRITKQMQAYQELLLLSCKMFKELYAINKDKKLLKEWHKITNKLFT